MRDSCGNECETETRRSARLVFEGSLAGAWVNDARPGGGAECRMIQQWKRGDHEK